MSAEERIVEYLRTQKGINNTTLSEIKITTNQNKNGENLLYVRADKFGKPFFNYFSNNSIYYAFDMNGNYVGCAKINVTNNVPPTQVEMEYWANLEYANNGNITVLAKEVIREVFEEKVFDGLTVKEGNPSTNIDSIMVAINSDNYASLAVAAKLGFSESGLLNIDDYIKQKEDQGPKMI